MIQIQNAADCCGCSACAAVCPSHCITLAPTDEGFLQAQVNTDFCIQCGRCTAVCPMLNPPATRPDPQAFAVISHDAETRAQSSSGGVFSLLAQTILQANGAVCGAIYGENYQVLHALTDSADGVAQMRGAKYVQSDKNSVFVRIQKLLDTCHPVLFTGTPCEVAGLLSFLGGDSPYLLTADLICHGTPSPLVWQRMLEDVGDVEGVNLRDKRNSWRKYNVTFATSTGEVTMPVMDSSYMRAFLRDITVRPVCANCPSKGNARASDLTLGDFWGVEKIDGAPDDDKGTSLILVHTPKGEAALRGLQDQVDCMEVSLEDALRYNPSAVQNAVLHPDRDAFFEALADQPALDVLGQFAPVQKESAMQIAKGKMRAVLAKFR